VALEGTRLLVLNAAEALDRWGRRVAAGQLLLCQEEPGWAGRDCVAAEMWKLLIWNLRGKQLNPIMGVVGAVGAF
jgi:hypothetical protein